MADVPNTWPLNGYAPGNYWCRCLTCNDDFQGDKRAITCLECAVKQVKAALLSERERRTAQGVTVPEGWALVPIEPCPEMVGAWYRYKNGHHFADEPPPNDRSDYGAYRAMLAAAPSLSSSAGGGERG